MKALVLLSNGLDSRLSTLLMKEKYEVEAIFFLLPFLANKEKVLESIKDFCKEQKVKLIIEDYTKGKNLDEYIEIIRNPKFGRGNALNPCADCHIFIIKKAKEYADKNNIKIIATGEVTGQRPLSQTSKRLQLIDRELGFKVTRPLVELGIWGRGREKQMELAEKFKINYPTPGGGCLLCEKGYCRRLNLNKKLTDFDIKMLDIHKHFEDSNIILGRNKKENDKINKLAEKYKKGIVIIPDEVGGNAWISDKKYLDKAKEIIRKNSNHKIENFEIIEF